MGLSGSLVRTAFIISPSMMKRPKPVRLQVGE